MGVFVLITHALFLLTRVLINARLITKLVHPTVDRSLYIKLPILIDYLRILQVFLRLFYIFISLLSVKELIKKDFLLRFLLNNKHLFSYMMRSLNILNLGLYCYGVTSVFLKWIPHFFKVCELTKL